jgi:hypothetical protein
MPARFEVRHQAAPAVVRGEQDLEHVKTLVTPRRYGRQNDLARPRPIGKAKLVAMPETPPLRLNHRRVLQLSCQQGRQQLGRQVTRSEVDPFILGEFAAKELASIGAFFPDDLRALEQRDVVKEQRARPPRRSHSWSREN